MYSINGKALSKTTDLELINLSAESLNKYNVKTLAAIERRLLKDFRRNYNSFKNSTFKPYALDAYFDGKIPKALGNKATRNSLLHRNVALQEYLRSESANLESTKSMIEREERRIFKSKVGFFEDENFNEDMRIRFWSAYQEFMNQNPRFLYDSDKVQQFLGRSSFWRTRDFTADDLDELLGRLERSERRKRK